MQQTIETILLILITVALIVTAPLMLAEGAWKIASEAGTRAWVDLGNAWNSWMNFVNWLYDSLDSIFFGGGSNGGTGSNTTTTGNMAAGNTTVGK